VFSFRETKLFTRLYPKNVADNIPADVLREIRNEVEDG